MMLDRFSIKQKFLLLGAVVAVAGLVVFLQTFNGLLVVKGSVDDYFQHIAQRQELQKQLHANLGYGGAIHRFKNYVLRGRSEDAEAFSNSVQASEALLEDYRGLTGLSADEMQALDTIAGVLDEYSRQLATATARIESGGTPQAIDARVKVDDTPAIAAFATLAGEFERLNSQHHSALQDNSDNMVVNTLWLVGVVAAVVSVLGVLLVMSITGRLARVVTAMDDVARGDGDLTHRIDMNGNDEFSHLARAFNHFVDNIQGVVSHVCDSTLKLQSSAGSLEEITDETNKAVQQQHQEVDQVATAMEQMTATVHEIAGNASQAASATEKADDDANKGKNIVGTTITSIRNLANEVESASSVIGSLEEDAASISTVMDVIKTIAEQTNLLALNAAIEAARAGEQGRGFAVVADEVRTLASRTQDSTHEIHEMVERLQNGARNAVTVMEKSSHLAKETVEEVASAGTSLAQITEAVDIINSMNFQVASASEEQSAVAEEINKNVVRISELAEVSSAGANRTKEASQELQALSAHLQNQVSRFKI